MFIRKCQSLYLFNSTSIFRHFQGCCIPLFSYSKKIWRIHWYFKNCKQIFKRKASVVEYFNFPLNKNYFIKFLFHTIIFINVISFIQNSGYPDCFQNIFWIIGIPMCIQKTVILKALWKWNRMCWIYGNN